MKKLMLVLCKTFVFTFLLSLSLNYCTPVWAVEGELLASPSDSEERETEAKEETEAAETETEVVEIAAESEAATKKRIEIYSILSIVGENVEQVGISESFSEALQEHSDRVVLKASQAYSRNNLSLFIKRRGWGGTISTNSKDCKVTPTGERTDIEYGPSLNVEEWTERYEISRIDPDVSEVHIQFVVNTVWESGFQRTMYRDITIPLLDARDNAPATPKIEFDASHPDVYMLRGVDSSMEYICVENPYAKEAVSEWTPCAGAEVALTPENKEYFCMVRYKATASHSESQLVTMKVPALRSAPSLTYDKKTETLSKLSTEMEYRVGDGSYKPVTEAFINGGISEILDQITEDTVDLKVRYAAVNAPASAEEAIPLLKRLDAPVQVTLDPVTFRLQGTASGMEYLLDTATSWKSITQSYVDLKNYALADRDVVVMVRYRYTTTNSNSKPVRLVLPQLTDAPANLTVDYFTETISGFDTAKSYQYATSLTGTWNGITLKNGVFDISGKIKTASEAVLYIRRAATADTSFSAAAAVTLPQRRAAPADILFSYNDATLPETKAQVNNLTSAMEYKLYGAAAWEPCPDGSLVLDIPTAAKTYYFRMKATGDAFASSQKSLSLKTYGSAPSCSLNITTEQISSIKNTMEYQFNGGAYTPVGEATVMLMSDLADSLGAGESYVIKFRYARKQDAPVSKEKVITVYPRPEPPTGMAYDPSTFYLSGVSTKMQYREKGTTAWKSIGSTKVKLNTLVGNRTDVQIEVRYKPAGGVFASKAVIVNLFK